MNTKSTRAVRLRTFALISLGIAVAVGIDMVTDGVPKNGSVVQVSRAAETDPASAIVMGPGAGDTAERISPNRTLPGAATEIIRTSTPQPPLRSAERLAATGGARATAPEVEPDATTRVVMALATEVMPDPAATVLPDPATVSPPTPAVPVSAETSPAACLSDLAPIARAADVTFAPGSSSISLDGREDILDLAARAATCPEAHITIVGVAIDGDPTLAGLNAELPQQRAENVLSLIESNGFASDRYSTRSVPRSSEAPVPAGNATDRRVLFVVTGDGPGRGG